MNGFNSYTECLAACDAYNDMVDRFEETKKTVKRSEKNAPLKNWCVTIFEFFGVDINTLKSFPKLKYGVINHEICPDTSRGHLQCYFEFDSSVRFSHIQNYFKTVKLHCEGRKGTAIQARDYCLKEESRLEGSEPLVWGTLSTDRLKSSSGCHMIQWIKDNSKDCTFTDYMCEFGDEYLRYGNNMEKMWNHHKVKKKTFRHGSLRDIQVDMINLMENQNDRVVPWIYDKDGGLGKSTLCDYLLDRGDCFWCSSGGYKDTFHAFSKDPKPYVIMDITRQEGNDEKTMKHLYGILEAFKSGRAFSGKYDSVSLTFEPAKVLVLSNSPPDFTKWTADRYSSVKAVYRGGGNTNPALIDFDRNKKNCEIESESESDDEL